MIRLIGDLVAQLMFIAILLGLGVSLTFFAVALILWLWDKLKELFL
jgi:hypothetical protein